MKLILASRSQERRRIFKLLGVEFEVCSSNFDESKIKDKDPVKLVQKLAEAKTEDVARKYSDVVVVGGDTLCVFENKVLGKPKDLDEAHAILKQLSGKTHKFISGFCLINTQTKEKQVGFEQCEITFRDLTDKEIIKFIENSNPLRLAAGYQTTGDFSELFISKINGSYSAINGLPMEKIIPILQRWKVID